MNELKKADEIVMWKRVSDFPQYEVSNTGLVRKGAKIKICRANSHGYPTVVLYENGKRKNIPVHRLVALAFIANPYNLPQVNHIDENKENNNVANLEWCDAKYNNNYSNASGRAFDLKSKPVAMLTFDGAVHGVFPGAASASRQTGISQGNISEVCTRKRESAGGYVFQYAADLIDSLQAQLTDYHHMEQLVDGKMAENQRLRKINEKLQSQLAASQRREKAAVEDINLLEDCGVCKHHDLDSCDLAGTKCHFEWRGPQAEEGEAK